MQRDPGVPIDFEKVFSDAQLAAGFGDNSYNFLLDDYARLSTQNGMTSQFSDESISNTGDLVVNLINTGRHLNAGATDVAGVYSQMYRGIRNTNVMLANMDRVTWTSLYNPAFIKGEQLFLRAFFYFELMKRFGGVVLLDKPQTPLESGNDLARSSYAETLAFIIRYLNAALEMLPLDWPDAAQYGRATKGAAMALKARALLHAASPLHNPSGDATKWKAAADAAKAIIDMNKYSLEPNYGDVLVRDNSPEYIMIDIKAPRGWVGYINNFIAPTSYGGAQSLISPTQNHVDLYEMISGKPITDPTSGYNPQQPYNNRDPRFYNNILFNDAMWQGRRVQTFVGGLDYSATSNIFTRTGYYLKRLWPEQITRNGGTGILNYVFFRYAEVLLNYAEALNEADGPTAAVAGAVNAVRNRAGMPSLPAGLTKDAMRERIRNERAVEFAFEDMRWWDILRWKKGTELVTQPMRGMQITRSGTLFSYAPFVLAANYQKVFEEHMHLYPIPAAEIYKSPGALKQNPGW
ncbi:MAG TPA: RagB/SusD family nutrient uptake outer membrane protein [Flavisolibacter sp.]|nr:RagB/SusD family nutrient uptake outer membrane protein [Flavisolibacter sp.]